MQNPLIPIPYRGPVTASDLRNAIWKVLAETGDYPAMGDLIIAVLTRPGQEKEPDELSCVLADEVRKLVASLFDIHPDLTYRMRHHHEFVCKEKQGSWDGDIYHSLLILAHTLGAYQRIYPPHLAPYLDYHLRLASLQVQDIAEAKAKAAGAHRPALAGKDHLALAEVKIEEMRQMMQRTNQPQHVFEQRAAFLREQARRLMEQECKR